MEKPQGCSLSSQQVWGLQEEALSIHRASPSDGLGTGWLPYSYMQNIALIRMILKVIQQALKKKPHSAFSFKSSFFFFFAILHTVLVTNLIVVTKISEKSNVRRKGLFWPQLEGATHRGGKGMVMGTPGSWASRIRSQEQTGTNAGVKLASPFYSVRDLSLRGWFHPHSGWVFLL